MGLLNRLKEERSIQKEKEYQRLMALSDKELLVEVILLLEALNLKADEIQRNQIVYGR